MNASEAYEKYKHIDGRIPHGEENTVALMIHDLWSAVKHEHFGQTVVNDVRMNGQSIMKEER